MADVRHGGVDCTCNGPGEAGLFGVPGAMTGGRPDRGSPTPEHLIGPRLETPVGNGILERMSRYPDRFLLGLDLYDNRRTDLAGWYNSAASYRQFVGPMWLDVDPGAIDLEARVRCDTAARLFGI